MKSMCATTFRSFLFTGALLGMTFVQEAPAVASPFKPATVKPTTITSKMEAAFLSLFAPAKKKSSGQGGSNSPISGGIGGITIGVSLALITGTGGGSLTLIGGNAYSGSVTTSDVRLNTTNSGTLSGLVDPDLLVELGLEDE